MESRCNVNYVKTIVATSVVWINDGVVNDIENYEHKMCKPFYLCSNSQDPPNVLDLPWLPPRLEVIFGVSFALHRMVVWRTGWSTSFTNLKKPLMVLRIKNSLGNTLRFALYYLTQLFCKIEF